MDSSEKNISFLWNQSNSGSVYVAASPVDDQFIARSTAPKGSLMNENTYLKQLSGEDRNFDHDFEPSVQIDPHIQEIIGKAFRAHYDDILKMPIPDTMLVLLAELEAKERATK